MLKNVPTIFFLNVLKRKYIQYHTDLEHLLFTTGLSWTIYTYIHKHKVKIKIKNVNQEGV